MYEVNLDGLEDMVFLRGVETVLGEDRSLVPKTLDKGFVAVRSCGVIVEAMKLILKKAQIIFALAGDAVHLLIAGGVIEIA